jgi:hypothetical protein
MTILTSLYPRLASVGPIIVLPADTSQILRRVW